MSVELVGERGGGMMGEKTALQEVINEREGARDVERA